MRSWCGDLLRVPLPRLIAWRKSLRHRCISLAQLCQWIDDQSAEHFWVEVGALGRHSFTMFTDGFDMFESCWHDESS